jgi:hypothetical protein
MVSSHASELDELRCSLLDEERAELDEYAELEEKSSSSS